ncbi:MAG: DUF4185 domain-containing protein [Myxococcales bacterium]|nr:DUF4185 domain-containing protein [Myxococcales bacterium]
MKSAIALALTSAVTACGGTETPGRPLAIDSVVDLGLLPLPPKAIGRDGGMSGALGGKVLWTFGDTFLTEHNHVDNSSVLSATSGWSTAADPLALVQNLFGAEPAQLVPYTADELAANTADALNGYALWPGTVLDVGEATAVVSFQQIKRKSGSGFDSIGVGTARISVDATTATRTPALLFAAPEPLYVPQVVEEGFVYAFSCGQRGFLDFACKLARAPLADVETRAAYEFYDGSTWTTEIMRAAYMIDQTSVAPSISYNAFLGKYLAVSCKILSSTVLIRTAAEISGPWGEATEIPAGTDGVLAPPHADQYNYLCVEHPELASDASIVIGYSRPTEAFQGDVRLARVTLR